MRCPVRRSHSPPKSSTMRSSSVVSVVDTADFLSCSQASRLDVEEALRWKDESWRRRMNYRRGRRVAEGGVTRLFVNICLGGSCGDALETLAGGGLAPLSMLARR